MVTSRAETVEEYLESLPSDRREALAAVRKVILANLPEGFEESMQYGMIGYSIPLSRHPDTYNKQPLAVAGLASQKGYMALYLMSVHGDEGLRAWFESAYRDTGKRMDMGRSCIRFRKLEHLPLELVGEAIAKVSAEDFIANFEASRREIRTKKRGATKDGGT